MRSRIVSTLLSVALLITLVACANDVNGNAQASGKYLKEKENDIARTELWNDAKAKFFD